MTYCMKSMISYEAVWRPYWAPPCIRQTRYARGVIVGLYPNPQVLTRKVYICCRFRSMTGFKQYWIPVYENLWRLIDLASICSPLCYLKKMERALGRSHRNFGMIGRIAAMLCTGKTSICIALLQYMSLLWI